MEDREVVHEFLVESAENLGRLDQEMVELEQRPQDQQLLRSIFRTIHTIKGTCGFLGFATLERTAHLAENLLSQLRTAQRALTPELVSLILEAVDAIRGILATIESTGAEGQDTHEHLRERLNAACAESAPTRSEPAVPGGSPAADSVPAADRAETEGQPGQKAGSAADSTIRVDVGLLDKLGNLVGELVLTRNQILQFNAQHEDATLNATSQRLNLITTELQEGVMKTRMQPIGVVWNKLPRLVRDLATLFGKQIQLEMDGTDTELDKTIIEAIKNPLTHIVRNCCDHGIERPEARQRNGKPAPGKILLRAFHEGGQVNIEIIDDGAGIDVDRVKAKAVQRGLVRQEHAGRMSDREALNLLFLPGFSTAESVTNVSGRGVGMDVVKTNIERIGGVVDLTSRLGEGTTLKLKIPLTLAIIPGLVVTSGGERFVIPQVSLLELIRLEGEAGRKQIERIHGTRVYRRRGNLLPVAHLNEVLALPVPRESDVLNIVVLQAEDRQFGLVVDGISDTQEIVVKPLGKQLKGLNCYAGATIMGDGRVALILDVLGIGQRSGVVSQSREQTRGGEGRREQTLIDRQTFLLFCAGSFERLAVPLSLVARLEEFPQSKVERAGGRMVVQHRGRILPLAPLGPILENGSRDTAGTRDPVQVIVFDSGDRSIGIVVDQISDIAEETVTVRQQTTRKGLLGSAVVGNKVTDFLDLHAVIDSAVENWFGEHTGHQADGAAVMVAEGSAFSRSLVRSSLEMAGYTVVEAANQQEALREFDRRKIDVLVTALDLPPAGGFDLLDRVRSRPDGTRVPVLALANSTEETHSRAIRGHDFQDYQMKFDREAMLRSIQKLAAAVMAGEPDPVPAGKES
jgi:two-component system chemotaxis sensor kinase CheA